MNYTELDDLKSTWQTLNRNLERQHALELHRFREHKLDRFRAGFRPLVIGQTIQIICGGLLAMIAGSFWFDHRDAVHLMVYGLSVHLYAMMLIFSAARDLFLIGRIDYGAPVLALQKQIAQLREWHQRAAFWFAVAGCFIWVPLLLMVFYSLGADVWARNPEIVGAFLLSGLVCLGILLGIVALSREPRRAKFARHLVDNAAGQSVRRAKSLLDELAQFERE
jgi:hypothetical protein